MGRELGEAGEEASDCDLGLIPSEGEKDRRLSGVI